MHIPQNSISAEDQQYLAQFTECTNLSMNNCGLTSVANFPKLAKLVRLELCDNKLTTLPANFAEFCPELKVLKLAGNEFASVDALQPILKPLSKLRCLDLDGCPVQEKVADYKTQMWAAFPTLEILDGKDRENNSVASESDEEDDLSDEDVGSGEELEDEMNEDGEEEMSEADTVAIGASKEKVKESGKEQSGAETTCDGKQSVGK